MINPKILKPKVMQELRSGFAENNPKGVQVQGFMEPGCYRQALCEISGADFRKSEQRDTHSYFKARHGALAFFRSREFLSFIKAITGKEVKLEKCSLLMFMAGSYTLLHDEKEKKKRLEFFFDLTPEWKNEWGGATVYLTKGGEKLMLPSAPNNVVIAESTGYVKYVNHLAGNNGRMVVHGTLDYE